MALHLSVAERQKDKKRQNTTSCKKQQYLYLQRMLQGMILFEVFDTLLIKLH